MDLDLSFLQFAPTAPTLQSRPVNVYDILRDGWRESRVDLTLQFFLDPNERHALGPLVIDALLTCLDGAPTITRTGRSAAALAAVDFQGSDAWEIGTQVDYIDVLATNSDLDVAIVLENKIGHRLINPLDRYVASVLDGTEVSTVLVAVLAPERRAASNDMDHWLSRSITYAELAQAIKTSPDLVEHLLNPADTNQRRSLDLLHQFLESRSGDLDVSDLNTEATMLRQWRDLVDEHHDAITRFEEAKRTIAHMLRARNKGLAGPIAERLDAAGLEAAWQAHGGRVSGQEFWNAYCFTPHNWSIELKLTVTPALPAIYVYDYRGRTYKNSTSEPLGLDWTATDDQIADAFLERVTSILEQVAQGTR